MKTKRTIVHDVLMHAVKSTNAVLMAIPFVLVWLQYYVSRGVIVGWTSSLTPWVMAVLFLGLYIIFGRVYDAFLVSMNRITEMVYSQTLAVGISDAIMFIVTALLVRSFPNLWLMVLTGLIQVGISIAWSYIAKHWYFHYFKKKRVAIIYGDRDDVEQIIRDDEIARKFNLITSQPASKVMNEKLSIFRKFNIETVFLCAVHSHDRNAILKYCIQENITVYVLPRIGDTIMSSAKYMHMLHLPVLRVDRYHPSPEFLLAKRLFDVIVSGLLLLLLSPIMLVTAIAVRKDGGPAFYRQTRLTKDGKEFKVLKFRSMRVDAEKDGVARLSSGENDDRITKVGRIIRGCRIDELPQLINILVGDMSIVGPRPERPEIAEEYLEELPEFALRLQAKAGLTGLAQVYGKYNTTPYDKLQMDLMYIANPSFREDLRIILATIKILFMKDSTEGIDAGATNAMGGSTAKNGADDVA